jgi:outer membrane protein OmpA-like peptidoglycan-associated protein
MFKLFLLIVLISISLIAQTELDSSKYNAKQLLDQAKVQADKKEIKMTIRNVDITNYPIIKLIVEAYNIYGEPLDTLLPEKVNVVENGITKDVISIEKISIDERVPVDFTFLIDQTGSMQSYIDAIRKQMFSFTNLIKGRGIDYTLSLVVFSDYIDAIEQPTENVNEFTSWLSDIKAKGGGDVKENALEAFQKAIDKIKYRPSANKVIVLVTDAPYHQRGEKGIGTTDQTTESIIKLLKDNEVRVFTITPPYLDEYKQISESTRGNTYDMDYPFKAILNNFSNQLTNLYAIKYKTTKAAIPDSIDISLFNEKKKLLTQKTIPIVELGRKLIIQDLLFKLGKAEIPESAPQLEVLVEFMKNRQNVTIMIEGHTDAIGSYAVNDRLSKERADVVKDYLIQNGIDKNRIKTMGYGERKPIASNNTEFGRKLNRRTEIVIISK